MSGTFYFFKFDKAQAQITFATSIPANNRSRLHLADVVLYEDTRGNRQIVKSRFGLTEFFLGYKFTEKEQTMMLLGSVPQTILDKVRQHYSLTE